MTIRTVDPNCRICRRPLLDDLSRRRRVGPDCWARLTPAQQTKALALAAAERDPFHVPEQRRPSTTARINHRNVLAAVENPAAAVCHHENPKGACPECRREADPWRAAELFLRDVLAQPHEQRRAERVEILRARYANVTPWTPPPKPKPRPRPQSNPAPKPTPAPAGPQQLELL